MANEQILLAENVLDLEGIRNIRQRTDDQRFSLAADALLKQFRQQIKAAPSMRDIKEKSERIGSEMAAFFEEDEDGKSFWSRNGGRILEANAADTEVIKREKEVEFGRKSLEQLLADTHNMLAEVQGTQGIGVLLAGLAEIEKSPFLNEAERIAYRADFLNTGVLNLALNDEEAAIWGVHNLPVVDKEQLLYKIKETGHLREQAMVNEAAEAQKEAYLADVEQALDLWQKAERQEISPAEFYVLKQQLGDDKFKGLGAEQPATPLTSVCLFLQKLNSGEKLTPEEVNEVGNLLIAAYQQGKISFEQAVFWQNSLMQAHADEDVAELLVDADIAGRIDDVLGMTPVVGDDVDEQLAAALTAASEARAFEALNLYDVYLTRKTEKAADMLTKGARVSELAARKLARSSWAEICKEYGLKEGAQTAISAEVLMQVASVAGDDIGVWRKFYRSLAENGAESVISVSKPADSGGGAAN